MSAHLGDPATVIVMMQQIHRPKSPAHTCRTVSLSSVFL